MQLDLMDEHPSREFEERLCDPICSVWRGHFVSTVESSTQEQRDPAKRMGAWLGFIERTEGVSVGTKHGVVTCRTVDRLMES